MTAWRMLEWAVVFTAALALHVVVFVQMPRGDIGDRGASGEAALSLAAMTPQLAAMVARVDLADAIETPERVDPSARRSDASPVVVSQAARVSERPALTANEAPAEVATREIVPPDAADSTDALGATQPSSEVAVPAAALPTLSVDPGPSTLVPHTQAAAVALPMATSAATAATEADAPVIRPPDAARPDAEPMVSPPGVVLPQSVALPVAPGPAPTGVEPVAPAPPTAAPPRSPSFDAPNESPDGVELDTAAVPDVPEAAPIRPETVAPLPEDIDASALAPVASVRPNPMPERPERTQPADTTAQSQPSSTQPVAERTAPRAQTSRPGQSAQRAAGEGGGQRAGSGNTGAASLTNAKRRDLIAQWGGQIRARIERRMPAGGGLRGTVLVRLVVAPNGRALSVGVARSSGDARLDRLVLQAVQRAGRLPRAPRQLDGGAETFSIPFQFAR